MKFISKIVWLIVFVLFFGFALKNDQIVTLQFFWGYHQSAPLIILLLVFFILGAAFCLIAMAPSIYRNRRALSKHKKTIQTFQTEAEMRDKAINQPPTADVVRR